MMNFTGSDGLIVYTILEVVIVVIIILVIVAFYKKIKYIEKNTKRSEQILAELLKYVKLNKDIDSSSNENIEREHKDGDKTKPSI
jgi:predicted Holliday junction resolvase-like endonuclease